LGNHIAGPFLPAIMAPFFGAADRIAADPSPGGVAA